MTSILFVTHCFFDVFAPSHHPVAEYSVGHTSSISMYSLRHIKYLVYNGK